MLARADTESYQRFAPCAHRHASTPPSSTVDFDDGRPVATDEHKALKRWL